MKSFLRSLALFLALGSPLRAVAADYVVFWSYQDWRNAPVRAHTFATFFSTDRSRLTERVVISWLPAPGYFAGSSQLEMPPVRIVPGQVYDFAQTAKFARGLGQEINRHGPYPITRALFDAAVRQREALQSGRVAYKMLDGRFRPQAVNCMHAISDIAGFHDTGLLRGTEGTQDILRFFIRQGHVRATTPDERVYRQLRTELLR
jgi:hypothetical protein